MNKLRGLQDRVVRIREFFERPSVRFGFAPAIFFLGPTFVVTYYSTDLYRNAATEYLPASFVAFLDAHVFVITVVSLLASFIVSNAYPFLERVTTNRSSVTLEGLLALKEAFEKIVEFKARRFETECAQVANTPQPPSPEAIFKNITKPDQQIIYVAYALHSFLEAITDNIEFKVRIIRVENDVPSAWYTYAPDNNPPKTNIAVVQDPDSAVSHCLRKKSLFVVQNIKDAANNPDGREYVMSHSDPTEEIGSLICYPVYHKASKCYPFVITISADKPYFQKSRRTFYKWVFDQFALRIQLEHSLMLLKERTNA